MSKLNYTQMHLRYFNRRVQNVRSPRIFNISNLVLPKSACLHYMGDSEHDTGPSNNNALLGKVSGRIPLYAYMDIATQMGKFTRITYNQVQALKRYIRENNKFKLVLDINKGFSPNPVIPVVMDYALADKRYKYLDIEYKANYYRQYNRITTLIKGMVDLYNAHGNFHHQFIVLNVPDQLMKFSAMKQASSGNMRMEHYQSLDTFDKIMVFELWKYLGLRREASLFKNMPIKLLSRINIVLVSGSVFTLFNLGELNAWRRSEENPSGIIHPVMLVKDFFLALVKLKLANGKPELVELTEEEQLDLKEDTKNIDLEEGEKITENEETNKDNGNDKESDENDEGESLDEEEKAKEDERDEDYYLADIFDEDDESVDDETLTNSFKSDKGTKFIKEEQEEEFLPEAKGKLDTDDIIGIKTIATEDKVVLIKRPTQARTPEEKGMNALNEIAVAENMPLTQYNGIKKALSKYNNLVIKGQDKKVGELIDLKPEDIAITEKDTRGVSTLNAFTKKYVNEVMERDVLSMLTAIQGNGVVIQDIAKNSVESITDAYDIYSIKIKPIIGQPSTVRIRIPKISEDGTFRVGGSVYSYANQRKDLPIRKINQNEVALTSYFGKTFVRRNQLRPYNYEKWLVNGIRAIALDKENPNITDTRTGDVSNPNLKAPATFTLLSNSFRTITTPEYFLYFDREKAVKRFNQEIVDGVENKGMTFCGIYKKKYGMGMKMDNSIHYVENGESKSLGYITDLFGMPLNKAPIEMTTISIMGKDVPIAIPLMYKLGLKKLLASLNPEHYRTVPSNMRPQLENHEYVIKFSDFNLVLSRKDRLTSLILGGLVRLEGLTKLSIFELEEKGVFFNVLEDNGIPGRYMKEVDMYYNLFVDPITERILIEMKEPTDFGGLLVRATEMLLTREHKDDTDFSEQRIAGFERMTGEIYTQLVKAMREHNRHGIKANYPVEMNPEAVWMSIVTDTAKRAKEDLNPIQDLKSTEEITSTGNGGRAKQSLVKRTRAHHKNAIGVVSEASKDSSDAGITVYFSTNPKLSNLYGMSKTDEIERGEVDAENVLSTASVMSPYSNTDDPKRVLFIGTQVLHTINSSGYTAMPLRTGYEWKLVKRTTDNYCTSATGKGKVESINDYAITILYEDGTRKHVELGRRYGKSGNFAMPHDMVTSLKVGDSVEEGTIIAYHSGFFQQDVLNPKSLAYRYGSLARVALMENPDTFEDSTAIGHRFAEKNLIQTTAFKDIVVNFNQNVHRILKPGTEVNVHDVLCVIEDSVTADTGLFDESSLDLLRTLSNNAPKSPAKGVIDRIEVFYNGDKEDMSETLRKLANITDAKLMAKEKSMGRKGYTGEVDDGFRVDGKPLLVDTAVIRFSITTSNRLGMGDKTVYANQLKCTISRVYDKDKSPRLNTPDNTPGEEIDSIFSTNSVYNRIVNSPFLIGMTNTLLIEFSKRLGKQWLEGKQ